MNYDIYFSVCVYEYFCKKYMSTAHFHIYWWEYREKAMYICYTLCWILRQDCKLFSIEWKFFTSSGFVQLLQQASRNRFQICSKWRANYIPYSLELQRTALSIHSPRICVCLLMWPLTGSSFLYCNYSEQFKGEFDNYWSSWGCVHRLMIHNVEVE